jgi:hypothetical protein
MALNRRPKHGYTRQVFGEDRSRQPMIGAAVHDPKRHFATVNCRTAKGHSIASSARTRSVGGIDNPGVFAA